MFNRKHIYFVSLLTILLLCFANCTHELNSNDGYDFRLNNSELHSLLRQSALADNKVVAHADKNDKINGLHPWEVTYDEIKLADLLVNGE